jgi:transposase-like protein
MIALSPWCLGADPPTGSHARRTTQRAYRACGYPLAVSAIRAALLPLLAHGACPNLVDTQPSAKAKRVPHIAKDIDVRATALRRWMEQYAIDAKGGKAIAASNREAPGTTPSASPRRRPSGRAAAPRSRAAAISLRNARSRRACS